MVRCLNNHNVRAEIGAKEQAQRFNHVGLFGFAARETQLCELFIRAQHNEFWTKNYSEIIEVTFSLCEYKSLDQDGRVT